MLVLWNGQTETSCKCASLAFGDLFEKDLQMVHLLRIWDSPKQKSYLACPLFTGIVFLQGGNIYTLKICDYTSSSPGTRKKNPVRIVIVLTLSN